MSVPVGAAANGEEMEYEKFIWGEQKFANYIPQTATIVINTPKVFEVQFKLTTNGYDFYNYYRLEKGDENVWFSKTSKPIDNHNKERLYTEKLVVYKLAGSGYIDDDEIGKINKTPLWIVGKWFSEDNFDEPTCIFTENGYCLTTDGIEREWGEEIEMVGYNYKTESTETIIFSSKIWKVEDDAFYVRLERTNKTTNVTTYGYYRYLKITNNINKCYVSDGLFFYGTDDETNTTTDKNKEPRFRYDYDSGLFRKDFDENDTDSLEKALRFESDDLFSIKFDVDEDSVGYHPWDGVLQYYNENGEWVVWKGEEIQSIDYDNKNILLVRGIFNTEFNCTLKIVGDQVSCIGDIRSLLNYKDVENTIMSERCFYRFFKDNLSLTSSPALPATTLAVSCYGYMFQGCTSLTSAPALPATTLAASCYFSMFGSCSSLISAPALPATTLAGDCYEEMFSNCTSLISVPALPATTLAGNCYWGMFRGCKLLKFSETKTDVYKNEFKIGNLRNLEIGEIHGSSVGNMIFGTGGTYNYELKSGQTLLWTSNEIIYPEGYKNN